MIERSAPSTSPLLEIDVTGSTIDQAYVYDDDGISGAEFANRPAFLRLMNAIKPRPPFQVIVRN
jgi:DNA invertase Pin-like site-specific DNA recombinase